MKKIIITTLLLAIGSIAWGQSNTFPASGNVGIGTASPSVNFHVKGTGNMYMRLERSGNSSLDIRSSAINYGAGLSLLSGNRLFLTTNGDITNPEVVLEGGKLGLGTTTPGEKLQIGNAFSFHDGGHEVLGFGCSASGSTDLNPNGYASEIRFDPTSGNFRFAVSSSITSYPETRLTIKNNGFVGIGTLNPDENLTVVGDVNVGGTGNGQVKARHINGKDHLSTSYGNLYLNYHTTSPVIVGTNASNSNLYVYGGVGIGTNSMGSHELAVEGSIGAREIKVEATGWSDFVFEKEFELRTLEEVEQHINEKGHLPGIPSEAEVNKNGINLGEMDAKLLQKIEELTLYMIDMNKQVQHLKSENQELKEKVQSLENE